MKARITKTERERIYQAVGKKLAPPRSKGLALLMAIGEYCGDAAMMGKHGVSAALLMPSLRGKRYSDEYSKMVKALKRLKNRRLLEITKKGDALLVALTPDGKSVHAAQRLRTETALLPNGTHCYVTFDIPEDVRHVRNTLRQELRKCDFEQVHKSVWRSPRDVAKHLFEVIQNAGAGRWATVIVGKTFGPSQKK